MLSQALGRLRDHEEQLLLQFLPLVLCLLLRRLLWIQLLPWILLVVLTMQTLLLPLAPPPPSLSLRAMMESFMTTQAAYGQLLNELLTEVASLRENFMEYSSAFPPPPPFED